MSEIKLNSIEDAVKDFKEGKFVIVVDDEDRENEGDLIIAAEKIDAEKVNFMLKHARGVLCAPITLSRCDELDLPHQVSENTSVLGTPFTITVDKLEGCSTGVSAHDRAETIKALADPNSTPQTFGRPGHINPLYAQDNGVLRRSGHTEAAIDLCKMAGLYPAGCNLVHQTDAASFLLHVDNNSLSCLVYHLHGLVELLTAVTTLAAQDVASSARRVDADQDRLVFFPFSLDECHVFQTIARLAERNKAEVAVFCRHVNLFAHFDE
jgi:3,4-dihydroxy-2-butanone 4-phosphate synthase